MVKKRQRPRRSTPKHPTSFLSDPDARKKFFDRYIRYLEGLADYSQQKHSYEKNDPRELGWQIGRQIVSQYLAEMILRTSLERRGITKDTSTHNLAHLFRKHPQHCRDSVEEKYRLILNSEVEWTWDVFRTAESFLEFLGKTPITKTRYPWQQQHKGTLYSPNMYRPLIYALYIALHGYPYKQGSFDKRFDTRFKSLRDSLQNERPEKNEISITA